MKKLFLMGAACCALLLSSCGISREAMNNTNLNQTDVVLAKKNFKVVGTVQGESTQSYWFGIGGMSGKSMRETAISEMFKNANLKGSQTIINVNVAQKNKLVLIHAKKKAIATGVVVEFTD